MTCRAAEGATTCAGTPTGAKLDYDNEGRLKHWQNTPSNPTTTDDFLYDGEGNRVEQQATISGSQVTTVYVAGGLEEITTSGITTTLTKYFAASGLPTVERVGTNGPLSYLASDGQGSVSETLDGGGTVTFQQLYTPYGSVRYSNGSPPTTLGYTGQRVDSNTGLDFYQARYYDPAAGQFTSADTVADGLNRYGYVHGNPATHTDPTGHMTDCKDGAIAGRISRRRYRQRRRPRQRRRTVEEMVGMAAAQAVEPPRAGTTHRTRDPHASANAIIGAMWQVKQR